jgi:hypothetical protein
MDFMHEHLYRERSFLVNQLNDKKCKGVFGILKMLSPAASLTQAAAGAFITFPIVFNIYIYTEIIRQSVMLIRAAAGPSILLSSSTRVALSFCYCLAWLLPRSWR